MIRYSPTDAKRINELVRKRCCNYNEGNCLLLDNCEPCICPQTISYSLLCKWFRTAVLPNDNSLYIKLMKPQNTSKCVICGSEFVKKVNNAKYCNSCRKTVRRRKVAEYKRKCIRKGNHSDLEKSRNRGNF